MAIVDTEGLGVLSGSVGKSGLPNSKEGADDEGETCALCCIPQLKSRSKVPPSLLCSSSKPNSVLL